MSAFANPPSATVRPIGVDAAIDPRSLGRRLAIRAASTLAVMIAAMGAAILLGCGGHLIYSLDDPYISLSLAWHIAHGHYGVNAGEAASPSSSILYPFLLAGFGWSAWQEWVPAVLNALAALGTGALFAAAFCRWGIITRQSQLLWGTILVVALCLALNSVGLVFVGLEHSLQALTSVFVVFGLARALEEDRVPAVLVITLILLPLWRFEGVALAGLVVASLMIAGHRRAALAAVLGIATALGAYTAAMQILGLPLLPSSVLRKSDVAAQVVDHASGLVGVFGSVLRNALGNLTGEAAPVFLLIGVVGAHPLLRTLRHRGAAERNVLSLRREWVFAAVVVGALTAQVLFGAWGGGFARYEAYAIALGAAGAVVLWGRAIGGLMARESPVIYALAVAAMLYVGQIALAATGLTPLSARGIYEMQYEMRRFSVEFYPRPVAVIDLGLVSYRNPHYVLDLWGLGSEVVRQARARHEAGTAWLDRLIEARHVGVAMVYDNWFAGQIPAGWQRLAVLQAEHRPPGFDEVTFYATSPDAIAGAVAALSAFGGTTGPGTRVTILKDF